MVLEYVNGGELFERIILCHLRNCVEGILQSSLTWLFLLELCVSNEGPSDGERDPDSPTLINAFQLIGVSSCLDLSGFFEKEDVSERKIRFTSHHSPKELLDRIENTVMQMGFHVQKKNGKCPNSLSVCTSLCTAESRARAKGEKESPRMSLVAAEVSD
ncbi:CBL-interacting protein kinase [Sesamum angolense]|uniref:CBL-interacting protein kinase n=1 Tax=Sesamum angolense TaxID=2727404 RepID=A0AAE1T8S3_9LAMI|nr:CBL-interacting protein kinase [Sesamum angolense]